MVIFVCWKLSHYNTYIIFGLGKSKIENAPHFDEIRATKHTAQWKTSIKLLYIYYYSPCKTVATAVGYIKKNAKKFHSPNQMGPAMWSELLSRVPSPEASAVNCSTNLIWSKFNEIVWQLSLYCRLYGIVMFPFYLLPFAEKCIDRSRMNRWSANNIVRIEAATFERKHGIKRGWREESGAGRSELRPSMSHGPRSWSGSARR